MITDKVRPHHLERKALLYVRQSSPHQVLHNRESSTLQYAMRDRLTALGWSEIEVIDEDLGRSAAGGVQRAGFERMVAQVCLGKVGAVCAREVLRFARNSRDWQFSSDIAHGWHRHVSLVMLAFAMMAVIRHRANSAVPQKMNPSKVMRRWRHAP